jgi:hypothetical protein
MTTGGNAGEMELRRIVAARYVSYGAILAAMTGLGLFFVAGVRDPSSSSFRNGC